MDGMKIKSGQKWKRRNVRPEEDPGIITVNRVSKTSVFWHLPTGGPEQKLDRHMFSIRFVPV